jgi:hypothetical protein
MSIAEPIELTPDLAPPIGLAVEVNHVDALDAVWLFSGREDGGVPPRVQQPDLSAQPVCTALT